MESGHGPLAKESCWLEGRTRTEQWLRQRKLLSAYCVYTMALALNYGENMCSAYLKYRVVSSTLLQSS